MNNETELEFLINPRKYWPKKLYFSDPKKPTDGNVLNNSEFIHAIYTYLSILRKSQYWNASNLEHVISSRLQTLVTNLKSSPFWDKYLRTYSFNYTSADLFQELQKLPIMERSFYANVSPDVFILPKESDIQVKQYNSGGTTGMPLRVKRTTEETSIIQHPFYFRSHDTFDEETIKNLLSRKFLLGIGGGGFRAYFYDFIHTVYHVTHRDLDNKITRDEIYATIKKHGPFILGGYSSLLLKFCEYVEEDNEKVQLIAARTGSEPIGVEDRMFIQHTLNTPVMNGLNFSEGGTIGFECPECPENFHVNSERLILEIVNSGGKAVANGEEGDIVVTILDSFTSPLLRYRIGDVGRMKNEPCPCGRTLPVFEFTGRRSEELTLPHGDKIRSIVLFGALLRNGLGKKTLQFQLQQTTANELLLLVVPKKDFSEEDARYYHNVLSELLKNEMRVAIQVVSEIPYTRSGKSRFFIPLNEKFDDNSIKWAKA